MNPTLPDLDALEEAEAKATARSSRKWLASYRKDGTGSVYSPSLGPCREVVPIAETMAEDAAFIAAMRNALPSLLDEIRRLRAELAEARQCAMIESDYANPDARLR